MLKIRIQASSEAEAKAAIKKLKETFPNISFSYPKQGNNPKYKGRQNFFANGWKSKKRRLSDY